MESNKSVKMSNKRKLNAEEQAKKTIQITFCRLQLAMCEDRVRKKN